MNKVKKVLMTMFGLLMLPLLFACSNTQSQGVEAIKAKGKLVVALNPEFAPFEYQKLVDGKNQIVFYQREVNSSGSFYEYCRAQRVFTPNWCT